MSFFPSSFAENLKGDESLFFSSLVCRQCLFLVIFRFLYSYHHHGRSSWTYQLLARANNPTLNLLRTSELPFFLTTPTPKPRHPSLVYLPLLLPSDVMRKEI